MNVLVTGAAGFIGSHFVDYLLEQPTFRTTLSRVVALDALTYAGKRENVNSSVPFFFTHIGNRQDILHACNLYKITHVVNFAAETHVDNSIESPSDFIETNVVELETMLRALLFVNPNIWFHQVSTDEVFGALKPGQALWTERSPYKPNSPYSASKAAADHIVRAYGNTYGLKYTISYCSNNYGPRQHPEKLIPKVISRALAGQSIPVYGDGMQVRDWLYVKDHCAGIYDILTLGKQGESYLFSGETHQITNLSLVRTILAHLEKRTGTNYMKQIEFVADRPGHDKMYGANPKKAKAKLGWQAQTSFYTGISKTIDWYLENK